MILMCADHANVTAQILLETARKKLDAASVAKNSNLQTVMLVLMDTMATPTVANVIATLTVLMAIIVKQSTELVLVNTTLMETIVSNVLVDSFHILSVKLVNVIRLGLLTTIAMWRTDNVNV